MISPIILRNLRDDGHYSPSIKEHSLEKIKLHNYLVGIFATAMARKWPQRLYLGLYSGPGRARIDATGEIIETTALAAFRPTSPFTNYIFVDNDSRCTEALTSRIGALDTGAEVDVVTGDANDDIDRVVGLIPRWGPGNGLISFCFVDPFAANLKFSTIRRLAQYKMDFLILLMLGRDTRTNFRRYLEDKADGRIAELIDYPNWRDEFLSFGSGKGSEIRFVARKFDERMREMGYQTLNTRDIRRVYVTGKRVYLYSLVFYSRHPLGSRFWQEALYGTRMQADLGL